MIKYIKTYFLKYKKHIISLSILITISGIISLFMPTFVGKFIDLLVYQNDMYLVKVNICIFVILSLVNIINSYLTSITIAKVQTKLSFSINCDIIEHLKRISYLKVISYDPVYLNRRINTDSNILITFFLNNYLNIFFNFASLMISICILYNIDKIITGILLFFIPIYILSYILLKNQFYKLNLKCKNSQDLFFSKLTEQITNIKAIKIDASFEFYKKNAKDSFDKMFKDLISFSKISYFTSGLDRLLSTIASASIFLVGGIKVIKGDCSIGEFTIIITYFNIIIGAISYYLNIGKSFQDCKSSFVRIQELLNIPEEKNGHKLIDSVEKIDLQRISFQYDGHFIFTDFVYTFKKGYIYCIKGHNGTGKSTLLNIIIVLIKELDSGNVYYNDIEISQLEIYKVRRKLFSIVPQDYMLNDVELEEFLKYINKQQVHFNNTANSVGDKNNINKLLEKIRMIPAKDGKNIYSGGENQKLCIVKALLKNSDVLIMDEPTSSLDIASTNILKEILFNQKKEKIIILISHDKYLEEICDQIIDLDSMKVNAE